MNPAELDQLIFDLLIRKARDLSFRATDKQLIVDRYVASQDELDPDTLRELITTGQATVVQQALNTYGNVIRSQINEMLDFSYSRGTVTYTLRNTEDGDILTWDAHPEVAQGGKSCPDCAARDGQKKTRVEWEALGTPGTGWSLCGGYCHCTLTKET